MQPSVHACVPHSIEVCGLGKLDVDATITRFAQLRDIGVGHRDLRDGKNERGGIEFD